MILKLKQNRASNKFNTLLDERNELFVKLENAEDYYHNSYVAYNEAAQEVDQLIASLAK